MQTHPFGFRNFLLPFVFLPLMLGFSLPVWTKSSRPPASENLKTLVIHPLDREKIIAATGHQIFENRHGGAWKFL